MGLGTRAELRLVSPAKHVPCTFFTRFAFSHHTEPKRRDPEPHLANLGNQAENLVLIGHGFLRAIEMPGCKIDGRASCT
jgi:hypothetical protein